MVKEFADEDELTASIISLEAQYGRYGTPRITAMFIKEGFKVNHKRVERIWRDQEIGVPKKQKRRRLWLNDGPAIRLRPEYKNHIWSYDIMEDKTYDGKKFMILNTIDEYRSGAPALLCLKKDNIKGSSGVFAFLKK